MIPGLSILVAILVTVASSFTIHAADWQPAEAALMTRWAKDVSPENAWSEYPRPQLVRDDWTNLNGLWDYAIQPRDKKRPGEWGGKILVPFAVESALSGVQERISPEERLWYRRTFTAPVLSDGERLLLHFGAVDWRATVRVNGKRAGGHQGGYDPFTFDVTDLVKEGVNQLIVAVWDPTDSGKQARGKQVLKPHGIWYTPVTGIWQTVWLERVPQVYVKSLRIVPQFDDSAFEVQIFSSEESDVRVKVLDGDTTVATEEGTTRRPLVLRVDDVKSWSPSDPHLYDLIIELVKDGEVIDSVKSYAGMRKITVESDADGVNRMFLNGEVLFELGPLDQGWWPDGLYTAPTDEALKYDIEITKKLGFNMTRKHVKVESERWYYWCDKLGLLVWQDMPSGDAHPEWKRGVDERAPELRRSAESSEQFREELTQLVVDFGNHPSIVVWVPFNERWGQSDTADYVAWLRRLDPTRLVNSASGGNFYGVGDILDVHSYPNPAMPRLDKHQAAVCGEFGGLGLPLEGHTLLKKGNWGYKSYENKDALQKAYLEKIDMLKPMIEKGLSAAVYTQITDVEIEVNGLLTYDRAVVKVDQKTVSKSNRSLYKNSGDTQ